jgi:hypothetical protein
MGNQICNYFVSHRYPVCRKTQIQSPCQPGTFSARCQQHLWSLFFLLANLWKFVPKFCPRSSRRKDTYHIGHLRIHFAMGPFVCRSSIRTPSQCPYRPFYFKSVALIILLLQAVLAAIIVQALKGMFKQFSDLPVLYSKSWSDLCVWISSFIITVVMDVDIGLVTGVVINVIMLLYWSLKPKVVLLGETDAKDLNVDKKYFLDACPNVHGPKLNYKCVFL